MKIRKVKWAGHPRLGDLELDFVNYTTNTPYDTVILAGENGTGKSTILEELSSFLNLGEFKYFEYIEYLADGTVYKAIPTSDGNTHPFFFDLLEPNGNLINIRSDRYNNKEELDTNSKDLRHYGCIFSRARSDYKTDKITNTSVSSLDVEKYDQDKNENFTSLKQLVVDVVNQDSSDYMQLNIERGMQPQPWSEYYPTSKIFRFKNAFDSFFDRMSYNKVSDVDGEKTILFSKNNVDIPVDELSTGEKQIVFRGIYLLKNSNLLRGAAIMVDEPELSMHPKWQRKILQYYKSLFTQQGDQLAQLFFATHSDHVLKEALSSADENIVITLEEDLGIISTKKIDSPSVLPSVTTAETTYLAFDIASNDYHIELYGWLQDKESKHTVKSCDDFIKSNPCYNPALHSKLSSFNTTTYETLPTYIRNAIHHPDSGNTFTEDELRVSIELLIGMCR
ncbi:TPA: AAA family ATPase [Vibrio parahaemolyticus]|uniref:AAA family ATPase n=1 Tax=Vibrio parahaemolyticus TaxID=670 RepID=UPI00038E126F|nr:ATP-binding protein [Vibrio parahaemolyticus]EQM14671.1 AAA ATPase domain protein [Vibrio parahaemolyticus 3259]ETJ85038.1 AAA ATPase domain protein [Vibrio parahaemolyticus EKP-008]HCH2420987.1 ATP-binding protein [Vibrio parahaemolyticus]